MAESESNSTKILTEIAEHPLRDSIRAAIVECLEMWTRTGGTFPHTLFTKAPLLLTHDEAKQICMVLLHHELIAVPQRKDVYAGDIATYVGDEGNYAITPLGSMVGYSLKRESEAASASWARHLAGGVRDKWRDLPGWFRNLLQWLSSIIIGILIGRATK